MKIKISNEQDAFDALKQALDGEISNISDVSLEFDGWPNLKLKWDGEGYESTVTPEIANAIIAIQHAINRSYSRVVHNQLDARSLKDSEKEQLRLKAKVEKGSSIVTFELNKFAEEIFKQVVTKMTPTEMVVTVVGLAAVAGATVVAKHYLNKRSEDKVVDSETQKAIALSEQETKRMDILAKAISVNSRLSQSREDFDDARHEIVKSVADAKNIGFDGIAISNESAKAIGSNKRTESKDVQLNDNYVILSVDHSHEDEVKLKLSRTRDGFEFAARFKDHSLDQQEIEKLKDAQWQRSKVYLSINATELRGDITSATVVGVVIQPKIES